MSMTRMHACDGWSPVGEDVPLARVAVQVAEEEQRVGGDEGLHQALQVEDGGGGELVRLRPLAVEVDARQPATVVA